MTDGSGAFVSLEQVRFAYGPGEFGLHVGRLDLGRGAHVACIGASGTGKTTLVNLIAGILLPDAGRVRFGDRTISALPDGARRALRIEHIGMVFQEFELLEYLTALENILLPFHVTRVLRLDRAARTRAAALAEATGIGHTLRRRPRHLSQGERQRVAICRALVTGPELVLCDEPTGNLDPVTAATTLDLLFDQVRIRGATLLMVTHNHAILDRFDEVIDIEDLTRRAARPAPGAPAR